MKTPPPPPTRFPQSCYCLHVWCGACRLSEPITELPCCCSQWCLSGGSLLWLLKMMSMYVLCMLGGRVTCDGWPCPDEDRAYGTHALCAERGCTGAQAAVRHHTRARRGVGAQPGSVRRVRTPGCATWGAALGRARDWRDGRAGVRRMRTDLQRKWHDRRRFTQESPARKTLRLDHRRAEHLRRLRVTVWCGRGRRKIIWGSTSSSRTKD